MPYLRSRRTALAATVALLVAVPVAMTLPSAVAVPNNNSSKKLQKAVTLQGMLKHERALQAIADANGGTARRAPLATTPRRPTFTTS